MYKAGILEGHATYKFQEDKIDSLAHSKIHFHKY